MNRFMSALRQNDPFTVEMWLFDVRGSVGRRYLLAGNAFASIEHRVDGLNRVFRETRPVEQSINAQPVSQ